MLVEVKDLEFLFFSDEIGPWEVGQFANWINSVNRECTKENTVWNKIIDRGTQTERNGKGRSKEMYKERRMRQREEHLERTATLQAFVQFR